MTDVPVLQSGDRIFVNSGPGLGAAERRSITQAFKDLGITVVNWTTVSGSGYWIVAISRGETRRRGPDLNVIISPSDRRH